MKRERLPSHNFARASYAPRVIGLALGFVSVAGVLVPQQAPWWMWIGPVLHAFVWPHLAWQLARRGAAPVRDERRSILVDHFFGGVWIAVMGFNLLPSVLMVTLMGMDSMIAGGRRQFVRGMLAHAGGAALGVLVFGLHWQPESDMTQVLTCLPLLLLHPISVGQITYRALTKLKRQREELAHLSQHDGLTGLYNRRHWELVVKAEFARYRRSGEIATLVLIDLDHFKRVNDTLGHAAGDTVLRGFAKRLRDSLRSTDIPGRYGGEEFGILLPFTSPRDASELMQRLQAGLTSSPLLPNRTVTASFGVAALTPDLASHETWMRLADQMLYRAKDRGRNCVVTAGESRPAPLSAADDLRKQLREDVPIVKRVLAGLSLGDIGAALFDPSDRLAWANAAFLELYAVPPEARSFAAIIRHCHRARVGARIDTGPHGNIEAWLETADSKRRSQPRRSFTVDLWDGRLFRLEEISFDDGWLLNLWTAVVPDAALPIPACLSQPELASSAPDPTTATAAPPDPAHPG